MNIRTLLKTSLCVGTVLLIGNAFALNQAESKWILAKETTSEEAQGSKGTKDKDNYISDSQITAKVKEKFVAEKLFGKEKISAMGIHVKTTNGVVHLKGKVSNKDEEDTAISLAKSVKGVKEVKSTIKIKENKENKEKH